MLVKCKPLETQYPHIELCVLPPEKVLLILNGDQGENKGNWSSGDNIPSVVLVLDCMLY